MAPRRASVNALHPDVELILLRAIAMRDDLNTFIRLLSAALETPSARAAPPSVAPRRASGTGGVR